MGKRKQTDNTDETQPGVQQEQEPAQATTREAGMAPAVVIETCKLHPDEIVVDEELNSRDSTGNVDDMVASLMSRGQEQPVRVRLVAGVYHLVHGYRRHKAARIVNEQGLYDRTGWPDGWKLRAEVVECSDAQAFASNVVENELRKNLTLMERARAMGRLADEFGWAQQEVADLFRCNRSQVSRSLKLLTAPRSVQRLVSTGKATAEAVLEVLALPEEEREEGFAGLQEEIAGGRKATKSAVRKKRKAKDAEETERTDNKRLGLKDIRVFWEGLRDEEVPEGASTVSQILADWVCRHMDGKYGDRAMRSRLTGLGLVKG